MTVVHKADIFGGKKFGSFSRIRAHFVTFGPVVVGKTLVFQMNVLLKNTKG